MGTENHGRCTTRTFRRASPATNDPETLALRTAADAALQRSTPAVKPKRPGLKPEFAALLERFAKRPSWVEPESERLQREREQREAVTAYLANVANVPPRFLHVDLQHLPPNLPAAHRRMAGVLCRLMDRPRTLVIGGPVGRGKTSLAAGLCRFFKEHGRSARYVTAYRYLASVSDAPFEQKPKIVRSYQQPDLVVIDELGESMGRLAGREPDLLDLIDHRWGVPRATVLLTNLDDKELWDVFGQRLQRRVMEGGGFHLASWARLQPFFDPNALSTPSGGHA